MGTCISHSPQATEQLGAAWGREAQQGWILGLSGDLGAGKTCLVKGLARGLGINERVQSPTFALVNVYSSGRLKLFHLDLYRLETVQQIIDAGLEEYLRPDGVTVIEWVEKWMGNVRPPVQGHVPAGPLATLTPVAPASFLRGLAATFRWVRLETVSETERRISYEDFGA